MIIDDFHVERVPVLPREAEAPLLVDPNTVLPLAITLQCLEHIRGRRQEIAQIHSTVEVLQLLAGPLLNLPSYAFHEPAVKDLLCILALK